MRKSIKSEEVLVIVHTFENSPGKISVNLDEAYEIKNRYYREGIEVDIENDILKIDSLKDFDGLALLLKNT